MKNFTYLLFCTILFMVTHKSYSQGLEIACAADQVVEGWTLDAETDDCPIVPVYPEIISSCGEVYFEFQDEIISEIGDIEIIRTWTAADDCGNQTGCSQNIVMLDSTPPVIMCPQDVTLECDEVYDPSFHGTATATDDSGTVFITSTEIDDLSMAPCEITKTVVWTATDPNGNYSTCIQIVKFYDTTTPVIFTVNNITVECGDQIPPPVAPNAVDNCTQVFVSYLGQTLMNGLDPCNPYYVRAWEAVDECGNFSIETQNIYIQDTTPPTIVCPPDDSSSYSPAGNYGVAAASDNCAVQSISYTDSPISGNCGAGVVRTWVAEDYCSNISSCTQLIGNQNGDSTPPIIFCPQDVTQECDNTNTNWGTATATDDVSSPGNILISHSDFTDNSDPCNVIITRTWIAEDECQNISNCAQIISLVDTTPPVISCPIDFTAECGSPWNFGIPNFFDNCTAAPDLIVTQTDQAILGNPCHEVYIRTWTVEDQCNNISSCSQTINVTDTTPPVISCPLGVGVECDALDQLPSPTVSDNCDANIMASLTYVDNVVSGSSPCDGFVDRVWTAVDCSGNISTCVQEYQIIDGYDPIISCPVDQIINKTFSSGSEQVFYNVVAVDNCDPNVSILCSHPSGTNFACNSITEVVCTATDQCGRTAGCSFFVTVNCLFISAPPIELEATDHSGLEVSAGIFIVETGGGCNPDGDIAVSFPNWPEDNFFEIGTYEIQIVAEDECGTIETITTTLTVSAPPADTTPPAIVCPPDISNHPCDMVFTDYTGSAIATDNITPSNLIEIWYTDVVSFGAPCNYTITRTWHAMDQAGNVSTCVQIIHIVDLIPPVIICPPDIITECGEYPNDDFGTPTVTDNCADPNILSAFLTYSDVVVGSVCLPGGQTITRTWTADDGCGNQSSCVQTIQLFDNTPPAIYCPDDITTTLVTIQDQLNGGKNVFYNVNATDICAPSVSVVCTPPSGSFFPCGQATLVTCVATDHCGHTVTCSFSVIVNCLTFDIDDVDIYTNQGGMEVAFSMINPNISGGCGEGSVDVTYPDWPVNNFFPIGTTELTALAIDECGVMAEITFSVNINEINSNEFCGPCMLWDSSSETCVPDPNPDPLLCDPFTISCPGDLNGDGFVNVNDLTLFLSAFGQACED